MSSPAGSTGDASETGPDESVGSTDVEAADLPLDQVFDVLRNERRRLVLRYLREREGPHTIGELAEHIAAHENDKPVQQLSSDERKRAYVGLYQCHLPKMDAMEIVRFNKDRGRVALGTNHCLVEPYLDLGERPTVPDGGRWPRWYLSLSATAALVVGLSAAGGQGATWLAAALVVGMFTVASGYHWLQDATTDDDDQPRGGPLARLLDRSDADAAAD
jgi:DNA-binding transcriptional ArsR family regulator